MPFGRADALAYTRARVPGQVSSGMVRWWENVVYASGTKCGDYSEGSSREVDQLSIDMAKAKAAVETTLRPYLDAPTFGEFLFPPELVRAIRRVGSVRAALR
jgi:hypothetical protein